MNHKCDTDERVCFYEQEFYMLSNFSAFEVDLYGQTFKTSEHAYQWLKFAGTRYQGVAEQIRDARSAHDAFKLAELHADLRRPDWGHVKVGEMLLILRQKANQHEYVHRKLLETGDRLLVEDSWRDDYWGWGPNKDGKNELGKLWMLVRDELRATAEDRQK